MKKTKLPQDLCMMIKIKNHQQNIDRQRIENQILKSKKLFSDPDINTPIFNPSKQSTVVDKVGCMPLEGGDSPKMKT